MTKRAPRDGKKSPSKAKTVTDEERFAERIGRLTSGLPPKQRKRIQELALARFSATEVLEYSWATLQDLLESYLAAYHRHLGYCEEQRDRGKKLQKLAESLVPDDPNRGKLYRRATLLQGVEPQFSKYLPTLGTLIEQQRKVQDSLAEHRPRGHRKVEITLVGHATAKTPECLIQLKGPPREEGE